MRRQGFGACRGPRRRPRTEAFPADHVPGLLPIAILGGSDLKPSRLPPSGQSQHALVGYKGADVVVEGRPLVVHLAERLRASGGFGPIWIVGPRQVYEPLGVADAIVDTDKHLGANLRAAVDHFKASYADGALAFLACDVLPTVPELREVAALWQRDAERSDVWFPLVRVPQDPADLRAFAWKPEYRLIEEAGQEPTFILPGHLIVADPRRLRMRLLYAVLDAAYRTRNRPIEKRKGPMARAVFGDLLWHDLMHLLNLRVPDVTWTVLTSGLRMARKLRAGTITRVELERLASAVVVRSRHLRRHPGRGARAPLVDALGLAKDVDTVEEAQDLMRMDRGPAPRASD